MGKKSGGGETTATDTAAMSLPGLWTCEDWDGGIPVRECRAIPESVIEERDKDFDILNDPEAGHDVTQNGSEVMDWI